MKKLSEGEVKKIVKNFKDNEVMEQFGNHRDFLLGGLDGKEEWKSRIAFADTYCEELAEIHQKFMEEYQIKPGENEFAYLKDANFRAGAGKERSRIIDMMKDYMAYRFYTDRKDDGHHEHKGCCQTHAHAVDGRCCGGQRGAHAEDEHPCGILLDKAVFDNIFSLHNP